MFITSVRLLKNTHYPNFLSHSLQGWGSLPVCLFMKKDYPNLVTFCARMRFLTKLSLFIEKYFPIPKLLVTCFAWMRLLTNLSLLMRKITQTFCHILCKDKFFHMLHKTSLGALSIKSDSIPIPHQNLNTSILLTWWTSIPIPIPPKMQTSIPIPIPILVKTSIPIPGIVCVCKATYFVKLIWLA